MDKMKISEQMMESSDVFESVMSKWSKEESPIQDTYQIKVTDINLINKTAEQIKESEIKKYAPLLKAGDRVLLSGTVYTSRDAAHKRIFELLDSNGELPYDLNGACIYFAGPTPTPEGMVIGSCGPTTSGRMDVYSPRLLDLGLAAMIGKGERNKITPKHSKMVWARYFLRLKS